MSSRVNEQIGNYEVQASDDGKLILINSSSASTVTLPQPVVTDWLLGTFDLSLENVGTGTVTVSPSSCTVDGLSSITLLQNQGARIYNDGTNYYALRGMSAPGSPGPAGPTGTGVSVVAKSSAYSATSGDVVLCTTTSAGFTVTLPTPTLDSTVSVKKISSDTNTVTVSPSSGLVEGSATMTISNQGDCADYVADGTEWWLI